MYSIVHLCVLILTQISIFQYISWNLMDLVAEEIASWTIEWSVRRSSKHAFCVWHEAVETKVQHHQQHHPLYHLLFQEGFWTEAFSAAPGLRWCPGEFWVEPLRLVFVKESVCLVFSCCCGLI